MSEWNDYQETVAGFFRELGLDAKTNQTIAGARTNHAIDVLVRSKHAGLDIVWLVECKAWDSRVPKLQVLGLRQIVNDTGADRGFIMAENGYQSGALEAASLSNIMLTSLADLRERLSFELGTSRLRTLLPRVESCQKRYWDIDKRTRIDHDLRPDVGLPGFFANHVIGSVGSTVLTALTRGFPVRHDRTGSAFTSLGLAQDFARSGDAGVVESPSELFDILHRELLEVEQRLSLAEASIKKV